MCLRLIHNLLVITLFSISFVAGYDLSMQRASAYEMVGCSSDSCCSDDYDDGDKCDDSISCSCQQLFVSWDCRSDVLALDICL